MEVHIEKAIKELRKLNLKLSEEVCENCKHLKDTESMTCTLLGRDWMEYCSEFVDKSYKGK